MRQATFLWRLANSVVCAASILLFIADAPGSESEPAVRVDGQVQHPGDWTVERLRKELASDIQTVKYTLKGQQHVSDCVPLLSLLKAAGAEAQFKMDPKADPKVKHPVLRRVVIVTASDGYTVVFSLAEMMPDIGDRAVWIALDQDGQPLEITRSGPVKLIVPDDRKPARWVHGVVSISVANPAAPTTRTGEQ